MGPRPAKRQKRLIVLSSDDDEKKISTTTVKRVKKFERSHPVGISDQLEDDILASPAAVESRIRPSSTKGLSKVHTAKASVAKQKHKKTLKEGVRSKPIHTFFNANVQPPARPKKKQKAPEPVEAIDDEEELSPSDSFHGKAPALVSGQSKSYTRSALDHRKPQSSLDRHRDPESSSSEYSFSSQRFSKASGGEKSNVVKSQVAGDRHDDDGRRLWAERFCPRDLGELAVHKKKVSDVRMWLENVFLRQSRKRLLILKGPAGSGKTITLSLLAKDMKIDVTEWRNPCMSELSEEGYVSMAAQFEEFLGRSGQFGTLQTISSDVETGTVANNSEWNDQRLVLVEEFPNTFTRSSYALESFRSAIIQYLAINVPGTLSQNRLQKDVSPLVLIVSETLLTSSIAAADSFTAHRLLGQEILEHPGVSVIEFNPIAPTMLVKSLELVLQKEARCSKRRRIPGPTVLKHLGEVGDIRSAIGSLEFLCIRGDDNADWGGLVAAVRKKGASRTGTALTNMEKESMEVITQRESSLGMFHAVGKVVYNKRDELAPSSQQGQGWVDTAHPLPSHLKHHALPNLSQVNPDRLIDETGTDVQTFIAALHENYILSCSGDQAVDHMNGCLDFLSDADLLTPAVAGSTRAGAMDVLRQNEICFQLSVRGILYSLPYPVKRETKPFSLGNGRSFNKSDIFRMFYPTSLRLWREQEEIRAMIDEYRNRLVSVPTTFTADLQMDNATQQQQNHDQETPNSELFYTMINPLTFMKPASRSHFTSALHHEQLASSQPFKSGPGVSVSRTLLQTMSSSDAVLLDRLPYLARITSDRALKQKIEKIVTFHGAIGPVAEEPNADAETLSDDKIEKEGNKKRKKDFRNVIDELEKETGRSELWIEEDDIVD